MLIQLRIASTLVRSCKEEGVILLREPKPPAVTRAVGNRAGVFKHLVVASLGIIAC